MSLSSNNLIHTVVDASNDTSTVSLGQVISLELKNSSYEFSLSLRLILIAKTIFQIGKHQFNWIHVRALSWPRLSLETEMLLT